MTFIKLVTFAFLLFGFTNASNALDWKLNDIDSELQISSGSTGGYVKICYDKGNKDTVAIFLEMIYLFG